MYILLAKSLSLSEKRLHQICPCLGINNVLRGTSIQALAILTEDSLTLAKHIAIKVLKNTQTLCHHHHHHPQGLNQECTY